MVSNLEGTELQIFDTVALRKSSSNVMPALSCLAFGSFCFGCICDKKKEEVDL